MNLHSYLSEEARGLTDGPPYLATGSTRWSYGDLFRNATHVAEDLARQDASMGDHVAIVMGNSLQYFAAYLGIAKLGCVAVAINVSLTPEEISDRLGRSEATLLLIDEVGLERLPSLDQHSSVSPIRVDRLLTKRTSTTEEPATPVAAVPADHPLLITYSSGSTAAPKAIISSHGAEIWSGRAHRSVWRINSNDVVYDALPLAWVFGLATIGTTALAATASLIVPPRFSPSLTCDEIAEQDATVLIGVTSMYRILVSHFEQRPDEASKLRGLRLAISGGEPRDDATFERFRELTGVAVHDAYAAAEARPVCTYDPLEDPVPRPGSAGKLVPGVSAEIRMRQDPEHGDSVSELWVKSPGTFSGYAGDEASTEAVTDANGWVCLGDLLESDSDGYWYVKGRTSHLISRGGATVSPDSVESVLLRHPQILEAAVVGCPHPVYGEEVVAFVVTSEDDPAATSRLVEEACGGQLAEFMKPTTVHPVDSLPLGPTGKVDRRSLASRAAQLQP